MSDYVSTTTWEDLADRLRSAQRVGLFTHRKPDGDAMGSVIGLARALDTIGVASTAHFMGPFESGLKQIADPTPWRSVEAEGPDESCDVMMVLDTGAWSQLEPVGPFLQARHDQVCGVDHHVRGDDVAAHRMVMPACASTTQALLPLIDALGVTLTTSIAEPLFVGLATDTGWFRHDNANADAFSAAARLLETGANKARLYQLIEETHRPVRLQIEARALGSVQYVAGGAAAIQRLTLADFAETGATAEDLTGIVNMPMSVGSVRASVLLTELEPGETKVSFRAKPAATGGVACDVNEVARTFGGGGHVLAAGARIASGIDDASASVIAAMESALGTTATS